ncbi:MAG: AbrB/MazE/SpoVT family DNA-binding domain-containing protein [Rhizomicrobium sp.]
MQVSKWGNSLAIRLPKAVVDVLKLKEGDDVEVTVADGKSLRVVRKADARAILARLRKYRGRMPADFKFDRLEAHERD